MTGDKSNIGSRGEQIHTYAYKVRNSSHWEYIEGTAIERLFIRIFKLIVDIFVSGPIAVSVEGSSANFNSSDNRALRRLMNFNQTESPVIRDFISVLERDDIVYDIGAHIGLYTCLASDVITPDHGCIVSFEPHSPTANELEYNCRLNNCEEIVQIMELAVSDTRAKINLEADVESLDVGIVPKNRNEFTVQATSIDEFVSEGWPSPTVVKIDTEGFEEKILQGAENALSTSVRAVYCELHSEASKEKVLRILRDHGFELVDIPTRRNQSFIRGTRNIRHS